MKKDKKKRKGLRVALIVLLVLLLTVLAVGGGLFYRYWSLLDRDGDESLAILESIDDPDEDGRTESRAESRTESAAPAESGEESGSGEDSEESLSAPEGDTESTSGPPVVHPGSDQPWDGSRNVRNSRSYVSGCESFNFINLKLNYNPRSLKGEGIINILLVGMDTRPDWSYGRSDVMIICTINKNTHEISLTSLARDTYLILTENERSSCVNRLNAAAAFGGMPYLVRTIERTYDIYIDYYVQTSFGAFATAIDDMGGLDLYLSAAEAKAINSSIVAYSDYSGSYVLDLGGDVPVVLLDTGSGEDGSGTETPPEDPTGDPQTEDSSAEPSAEPTEESSSEPTEESSADPAEESSAAPAEDPQESAGEESRSSGDKEESQSESSSDGRPSKAKLSEKDGVAHLNGNQVLAYCRLRSIDNDLARSNRQRKTLVAVINKAKGMSWSSIDAIATRTLPKIRTNMSAGQFMSLLSDAYSIYRNYSIHTYCLPQEGTYEWCWSDGGRWIIRMDFAANINYFYETVYQMKWDGK